MNAFSVKGIMTWMLATAVWLCLSIPLAYNPTLPVIGFIIAGLFVIAAAYVDAYTYRLPYAFTLCAAAFAIMGTTSLVGLELAILGAACGFLMLKIPQLILRAKTGKDCFGSGDCILMLSIGAMLGAWVMVAILLATVSAMVIMRGKRITMRPTPFGPFLAISGLGLWLVQQYATML